jgi:hypothetical protein
MESPVFGGDTTEITNVHVRIPTIAKTMNLSIRESDGTLNPPGIGPERNNSTPETIARVNHPADKPNRFSALK